MLIRSLSDTGLIPGAMPYWCRPPLPRILPGPAIASFQLYPPKEVLQVICLRSLPFRACQLPSPGQLGLTWTHMCWFGMDGVR